MAKPKIKFEIVKYWNFHTRNYAYRALMNGKIIGDAIPDSSNLQMMISNLDAYIKYFTTEQETVYEVIVDQVTNEVIKRVP
ncbi:MAG: hypothetical protein ACOXZV_00665 [Bacteroidales bacterium]|jgi:hypothetical protein